MFLGKPFFGLVLRLENKGIRNPVWGGPPIKDTYKPQIPPAWAIMLICSQQEPSLPGVDLNIPPGGFGLAENMLRSHTATSRLASNRPCVKGTRELPKNPPKHQPARNLNPALQPQGAV